jgi:hypothetical protein
MATNHRDEALSVLRKIANSNETEMPKVRVVGDATTPFCVIDGHFWCETEVPLCIYHVTGFHPC